jgi:hypothetical protein
MPGRISRLALARPRLVLVLGVIAVIVMGAIGVGALVPRGSAKQGHGGAVAGGEIRGERPRPDAPSVVPRPAPRITPRSPRAVTRPVAGET